MTGKYAALKVCVFVKGGLYMLCMCESVCARAIRSLFFSLFSAAGLEVRVSVNPTVMR